MTDQPSWMIVGLGNPGKRFERTRHNVGFMVVDELRRDLHSRSAVRRFDAEVAESVTGLGRVILLKPQTFMNLSGNSVAAAQRWYRIPVEHLLVIYDDLDLPFGQLRMRPSGSSGGHNGMTSIINRLGTQDFPRLRLGIGRSEHSNTIGYVLSRFSNSEETQLREYVSQAVSAAKTWHEDGIETAMNHFNRRESTGTQSVES